MDMNMTDILWGLVEEVITWQSLHFTMKEMGVADAQIAQFNESTEKKIREIIDKIVSIYENGGK